MTDLNMADDLWAWLTEYPDGSCGLIAAIISERAPFVSPLIGRNEEAIRSMETVARVHGAALDQRVWLRRYTKAEDFNEPS